MNVKHLDENPFVGFPLLLQPCMDFGHQLYTVNRAQINHELTNQPPGYLKHLSDIVQVEEISMK